MHTNGTLDSSCSAVIRWYMNCTVSRMAYNSGVQGRAVMRFERDFRFLASKRGNVLRLAAVADHGSDTTVTPFFTYVSCKPRACPCVNAPFHRRWTCNSTRLNTTP